MWIRQAYSSGSNSPRSNAAGSSTTSSSVSSTSSGVTGFSTSFFLLLFLTIVISSPHLGQGTTVPTIFLGALNSRKHSGQLDLTVNGLCPFRIIRLGQQAFCINAYQHIRIRDLHCMTGKCQEYYRVIPLSCGKLGLLYHTGLKIDLLWF
jgi:hypothetical protein